ncbi:hypothetical protein [Candidatus Nitrosotenuis aquarius]|uniref:hypothetical protein n=1 Tax=Candidatus Nitrosotenuis aquarius TaxID=1846278 RepID=UPI000C1F2E92|nr:hypothetical protein [Candidatus Nitrosotenuis aquarius]
MSTAQKISEAKKILANLESTEKFDSFVGIIHDIFLHLLDEYNVKFGLKIDRIGLEKFKTVAKKSGNIDAINFLIWYEKEYKKLRNDPELGQFLEREYSAPNDMAQIGARLLDEAKKIAYYAYENF